MPDPVPPAAHAVGIRVPSASVAELLAAGGHSFSFEFFPPQTDDGERLLWQAIRELEGLRPTFVSVTYGAGGSTRDRTVRVTQRIAEETTLLPMGHLTCVGSSVAELRSVIGSYADAGVRNVLALRGDPPGGPGSPWEQHPDGLAHADELVRARALARRLLGRRRGVPRGSPRVGVARRRRAGAAGQAGGRARSSPSPRCSSSASHYFDARRPRARPRLHDPDPARASCPSPTSRQIERFAVLSGTAFPDGLAARFRAVADDPRRRARARCRGGLGLACRSCSTAARPACTSSRSTARPRPARSTPVSGSPRTLTGAARVADGGAEAAASAASGVIGPPYGAATRWGRIGRMGRSVTVTGRGRRARRTTRPP